MARHESGINFQNLIRDLAEMYPYEVSEVILVELIANALDAKATKVMINYNQDMHSLIVEDNGKGMDATGFDQYHDFAAGLKTRGTGGIGFAGVGAKIAFNIADRVITETKSESYSNASNWYLQSKKDFLWDDIEPVNLQHQGTRVEIFFNTCAKLPFDSTEAIIKMIKSHYLPLFDNKFLTLYAKKGIYSPDTRFCVNGEVLEPCNLPEYFELDKTKEVYLEKASKKYGYGFFGLSTDEYPIGNDSCGVLLCTYGKVIKSDFFNQFPGSFGPRILGVIEVPGFIDYLTTSKTEFNRRLKHREFESLYDPIRQEFKAWLNALGVQPAEVADKDEAGKVERELKKILDDIPQLSDLFGFRTKKNIPLPDVSGAIPIEFEEGTEPTIPIGTGFGGIGTNIVEPGNEPGLAPVEKENGVERAKPISRIGKRGPKVTFSDQANRIDLAWVEGNNIVINKAHPTYKKVANDNTAKTIVSLFAIAGAIQRFIGSEEATTDPLFTDKMMAAWGRK